MKPPTITALRCWLFAALALGCAIASSPALHALNRQRAELGLTGFADTRGLPPEIALTATILGPFRAIFIDILWMRATALQDQGQFFELVQLYDWISKLEPRFPLVWEYMAWNFSYNISVKFPVRATQETAIPGQPDPQELRWQWVCRGIETLRDFGIHYNPKAYSLYRELAWIYSHKIGSTTDDAHVYYKVMVAMQMQAALGQPPYLERLTAIAAAPHVQSDPLPKKTEADAEAELLRKPAVAALVQRLREAGVDPFDKPLDVANRVPELPDPARAILDDPGQAGPVADLDAFLRARYLCDKLKLDPDRMLKLMKLFGPIDWRLPDALAFYWASRSLEVAVVLREIDQAANAFRIQFHSMANLYRRGRLLVRPPEPGKPLFWVASPNFDFLDYIVKLHDSAVILFGAPENVPFHEGYLNFLREAIVDLYLSNKPARAAQILKLLQSIGPEPKGQLLDDFIRDRWKEISRTLNAEQTANLLLEFYFQSFYWAALGDPDQAVGRERLAQLLFQMYQRDRPNLASTFPPLREIKKAALREALRRFPGFMIQSLRGLYPDAVKEAEAELKKEQEPPAQGPGAEKETPTEKGPGRPRPGPK